jgi:hypothetical protein
MNAADTGSIDLTYAVVFLMPVVSVIGIFTLLAVLGWAKERRRERESLYRHETARKLVELGQMSFDQFLDFEREEAARPIAGRRRALALAGWILAVGGTTAVGALATIPPETAPGLREFAILGIVPATIGMVLIGYVVATRKRA